MTTNETPKATQKKSTTFMLALIALIFTANIATGITPSLAGIGHAFPGVEASKLQSIVSIAALCSFFASLLAGKLQDFLTQKTVVLMGTLALSAGIIPVFFHTSFPLLLVISGFFGVGSGLMTATIPAMISRNFEGEEKGKMMGLKTGFQGLGTMLMTFIGGVVASVAWYFNYGIFAVGIVAFVIGLLFLPNDPVIKKVAKNSGNAVAAPGDEKKFTVANGNVILLLIVAMSLTMLSSVLSNNMSLHADIQNIGDSSISGLALSFNSLGAIVAGFISGTTIKIFKKRTMGVAYLFMAVGLVVISFLRFKTGMVAGSFIFGLGYGTVMTRLLFLLTSVLKSTSVPMGISFFSALTSLAFAFSPLIMNNLAKIFTSGSALATSCFSVGFCIAAGIAVLLLLTNYEGKLITKVSA